MNQKGKKAVASLEVRVGDHAKLAPSQKGFQEGDMHDSGVACSKKTQVVLQSSPRFVVLGSESPCFVYVIHHHTSVWTQWNQIPAFGQNLSFRSSSKGLLGPAVLGKQFTKVLIHSNRRIAALAPFFAFSHPHFCGLRLLLYFSVGQSLTHQDLGSWVQKDLTKICSRISYFDPSTSGHWLSEWKLQSRFALATRGQLEVAWFW